MVEAGLNRFGGSALVLRARRGPVAAALRVFDPDLIERFGENVQLERIDRELTLKGKEHPNLVRILDGGRCPRTGFLYVLMELLPGDNLANVLRLVPRDRIWPLLSQIAAAARFLEDLGLVHRDRKPSNIFSATRLHPGETSRSRCPPPYRRE